MKIKTFFIFFVIFSIVSPVLSFDFVTVTDVVKEIKKNYQKIENYSANFKISIKKETKNINQNGQIKAKYPDKLLITFYNPRNQTIVSDGKMMWIYIPSLNVVAEQDINKNSSIFSSNTRSGLNRLFSKYHYKFASKDQPVKEKDGAEYYILSLKQKESRSGYKTLTLWISKDYYIKKALGETAAGKTVEIIFSNIKTDINLQNGLFKFNVPSKARVIKNPMISEE